MPAVGADCRAVNRKARTMGAQDSLSRRDFLAITALAFAGNSWANPPAIPSHGKIGSVIGFGKAQDNKRYFISTVDFEGQQKGVRWQSDIDFFGHGFMPNPRRPHLAVVAEKHGRGCIEWDMAARKVTRALSIVGERQFYGHGVFTPDAKHLLLVETVVEDGSYRGVISIRDGTSYELLGEFPSYGAAPHDVILIDGGKTLVVTNGGGVLNGGDTPCVCFVDVKTRALRRRVEVPGGRMNAGHLALTLQGGLVVVSAPRTGIAEDSGDFFGGISFALPGQELHAAEDDIIRAMKGETLSLAIHQPSMVVAATSPAGGLLTFWDLRSGKLIKASREFQGPRGVSVTLNGRYFVLTYGKQGHAVLIDTQTLQTVEESYVERTLISGSHNFVHFLA
jgi:hypothetical protein